MLRRLLHHRAVTALVVWTFLVWTTRIRNIWGDGDLDTGDKLGRTALALSFTALALAVLLAAWRRPASWPRAVQALAGWTFAVWLVRAPGILVGDWSGAFKVVHTVLAVVSIGLAAVALRSLTPATTDRATSDRAPSASA